MIDILRCLVERLGLENIVKDKVLSIIEDDLTIKNMTYVLYLKQSQSNQLMRFCLAKSIAEQFYL